MSSLRPSSPEPYENQPDTVGQTSLLGLDYKVAAAVAYVPLVPVNVLASLAWLKTEQNSDFLRFHAMQSLVLTAGLIGFGILLCVCSLFIMLIPVLNVMILPIVNFVWGASGLAYVAISIYCLIKAHKGETVKLPYIGDFAAQKAREI